MAGGLLLALALRYGLLENEVQARMCREGFASHWCAIRSALGWSIHYQLIGLTALALGVAGWLPGLRRAALPALLLAAGGLLLYNATFAAVALVVALLAALRPAHRASAGEAD